MPTHTDRTYEQQLGQLRTAVLEMGGLVEEQIAQDIRIASLTSDLDTLFELAREGENVNGDLEREIKGVLSGS